ncbi:hypothetical protein AVEN_187041-1 [Araneus ventricosus]|uniref:Uncharacterized protein n=1 Tax=Araneus ventricosus TaxID=182803 RepID=A0A4Y2PU09_ARAVE|nr:hypothetical protein AVEN_187041-1 [Araneus ventricosus]
MTRTTPELPSPSLNFRTKPAGRHLAQTDLVCTRPNYNPVSNLEPFSPKPETLPKDPAALFSDNNVKVKIQRKRFNLITSFLQHVRNR